ncbi:MAG: hypothetical protein Q8L55_08625 [Phycisphaerales bacterium]|nr:hypothetical protein [Phycisphaerales bacterium]
MSLLEEVETRSTRRSRRNAEEGEAEDDASENSAVNAVGHDLGQKVEDESSSVLGKPEVGKQLGFVDRKNFLDALQFDDDSTV